MRAKIKRLSQMTVMTAAVAAIAACQTAPKKGGPTSKSHAESSMIVRSLDPEAPSAKGDSKKDRDRAARTAKQIAADAPSGSVRHTEEARAALFRGDAPKAEELAKKALSEDFKNRDAKIILAHASFQLDRPDAVETAISDLGGEKAPEAEVQNLTCLLWVKKGDNVQALKFAELAVQKDSKDSAAHLNAAALLAKAHRWKDAEKHLNVLLSKDSDNVDANLLMGVVSANQGRNDDAERRYNLVLDAAPGHGVAKYNLGILRARQGKLDAAIKVLEEASHAKAFKGADRAAKLASELRIERGSHKKVGDQEIVELADEASNSPAQIASLDSDQAKTKHTQKSTNVGVLGD